MSKTPQEIVPPTTDVHAALSKAAAKERDNITFVNTNFKCHPLKKQAAEQICEQNGATLSGFLRECIDGLIVDYMGAKALSKLTEGQAPN